MPSKESKNLTALIIEKTIEKLKNKKEFDSQQIAALKQLTSSDSMTKTNSLLDILKYKGDAKKNETNQS